MHALASDAAGRCTGRRATNPANSRSHAARCGAALTRVVPDALHRLPGFTAPASRPSGNRGLDHIPRTRTDNGLARPRTQGRQAKRRAWQRGRGKAYLDSDGAAICAHLCRRLHHGVDSVLRALGGQQGPRMSAQAGMGVPRAPSPPRGSRQTPAREHARTPAATARHRGQRR